MSNSEEKIKPITKPHENVRKMSNEGLEQFLLALARMHTDNVKDELAQSKVVINGMARYWEGRLDEARMWLAILEEAIQPGTFVTANLGETVADSMITTARNMIRASTTAFWAGKDRRPSNNGAEGEDTATGGKDGQAASNKA